MDNLGFGRNPYIDQQADAITQQYTNQLTKSILPQIGSNAQFAGGYGGSRQGVAEGNAVAGAAQGLGSSLANLYGNAYNTDQTAFLQNKSLDNNFALTNQGQNQNFYTQQRQLDQSGAQLGANLFGAGNAGYLSQGQGLYGLGNTQQQAPWNVINNATNNTSPFTGLGTSQNSTQQGSLVGNVLGGAMLGSQVGKNLGFGSNSFVPYNSETVIPMQPGGGY